MTSINCSSAHKLVAALTPAAAIFGNAAADGTITTQEWTTIAIALAGAAAVYWTPNRHEIVTVAATGEQK
jgi:hypothetical protein